MYEARELHGWWDPSAAQKFTYYFLLLRVSIQISDYRAELYDTTVEFFALRSPSFSFSSFTSTNDSETEPSSSALTPVPDPIAKLTKECGVLRERLDVAERRRQSECSCRSQTPSGSTQPSMRRELEVTKNELARSQVDVVKLEERCRMLEKTVRETKEMLRVRDLEVERMRKDKERERERLAMGRRYSGEHQRRQSQESVRSVRENGTEQHNENLRPPVDGTQNGRRSLDSIQTIESLNEERAQARSLETFLTRTDSWSGAQILQAVLDLNSEILQFAASATENCTFDKFPRPAPPKPIQATHDTTARLGPHLARVLSTRDHVQDPILVQLALQGCISTCVARSLSTFCIGFQTKVDTVLSQIYAHMYVAEPQPTSSKWRALTHRHIHTLHPNLDDYAVNDLVETIFRWSSDVFTVAGCSNADLGPSSREGLRTRFGEQVRRIAKSVCKLAQVTREEIMSTNFDVVLIEYGEEFEARGMYDAFGEYVSISKGPILCTTELGLKCTTRKSASDPTREEDGSIERRILLQPKVVLESVLDVLDPK